MIFGSSGKDKHRILCVLTICANGSLAKSFIILKGLVKPPKVNLPDNLCLSASKSGFLDGYLMIKYLTEIIEQISKEKGELILMMDDLNAHGQIMYWII